MSQYVFGAEVESDLDAIWEYIAQDDIDAADRWLNKLFDAFDQLARAPGMGHTRSDLTHLPVLFWPVGSYLIVYRVLPGSVQIIAVTQGSRDVIRFLKRRSWE